MKTSKMKSTIATIGFGLTMSILPMAPAFADDVVANVVSNSDGVLVIEYDHGDRAEIYEIDSNCSTPDVSVGEPYTKPGSGEKFALLTFTTSDASCSVTIFWSKGSDTSYGSLGPISVGVGVERERIILPTPIETPEVKAGKDRTRVFFSPDSPKLSGSAVKKIKQLVKALPEGATDIVVTITGYIHPTTETDPELKAYRQSLPELRAKAVKRALAKLGIEAEFEIVGITTPLTADPKSRRAVITISYTY